MRLIVPLLVLAAAAAMLTLTPAGARIAGFDHATVAAGAGAVALLSYLLAGARPSQIARMVSSLAAWALLFALVAGLYAYRFDASDFIDRMTAELMPSEPVTGAGGEAIIRTAGSAASSP